MDDEPTTFAVGSGDPSDPDVIRGCIDDGADTDTFDLDDQDIGTGTITVRSFAAAGVAEFDTPTSSDFVACDPGGSSGFAHQADSAVDVAVRAPAGAAAASIASSSSSHDRSQPAAVKRVRTGWWVRFGVPSGPRPAGAGPRRLAGRLAEHLLGGTPCRRLC